MLPNLFIVGTPKAGTTSLHHYLDFHPEVFMSNPKETNYFTYEEIKKQKLYYNEEHISTKESYLALFKNASNSPVIGEASVSYLFYPGTAKKIFDFNPKAKIIIILRNPVERCYSHYLMDKRLGFVKEDLETIISEGSKESSPLAHAYQQFVELGFYSKQIEQYLEIFPKKQIKIFIYEEISAERKKFILDVCAFLGIRYQYNNDFEHHTNTYNEPKGSILKKLYASKIVRRSIKAILPKKQLERINKTFFDNKKPILAKDTRALLGKIYESDIAKTEAILGTSLNIWKR
jgi:hypothetical protein